MSDLLFRIALLALLTERSVTCYGIGQCMAETFYKKRVLLAGDSCAPLLSILLPRTETRVQATPTRQAQLKGSTQGAGMPSTSAGS